MDTDETVNSFAFKRLRILSIICVISFLSPLVITNYSVKHNFVVYTDSMYPIIKKGDMIFTKNVDIIENGTILVFNSPLGGYEAHRVIDIIIDNDIMHYVTKGDNNAHRDSFLLTSEMVVGEVVKIIPIIGSIFLIPREIFLAVTLILIILYIYLSLKPDKRSVEYNSFVTSEKIAAFFLLIICIPTYVKCDIGLIFPGSNQYMDITIPKTTFIGGPHGETIIYDGGNNSNITLINAHSIPWWDVDYDYRKEIVIHEESGSDLTDYPVTLQLNTNELMTQGKMDYNCSDIRFIGSSFVYKLPINLENSNDYDLIEYQVKISINDVNILSHIESGGEDIRVFYTEKTDPYNSQDYIPIWIKEFENQKLDYWVNVNISANSMITLNMYYGQNGADSTIDGSSVFQYYDDFTQNTLSNYQIIDLGTVSAPSNWRILNGVLEQTTNIYTHGAPQMDGTYAVLKDNQHSNCTIEAQIKSTDDDSFGLIFGYTDNSNYYRFSWLRQDHTSSGGLGPGRYLQEHVDGNWVLLDSDNVQYSINQWYDLEIRLNNSEIIVYVDDGVALSGYASTDIDGRVGFYSWACQNPVFDNFRIRKNAKNEPIISFGVEDQIVSQTVELPYWIESGLGTTNTKIWVKIPLLLASQNESIFLYYGNPDAASSSNPKTTFTAYQNFITDGIDGGVGGQDGQSGFPSNFVVSPDGSALNIIGNVWKYTIFPLSIVGDGSQILEFSMRSFDNGELQGVGISNTISGPDSAHTYKFTGSQSWGLTPNQKYAGADGDWQSVYALLDDFSGSYQYFIWMGDDDADGSQNCSFKDVRIRPFASLEPTYLVSDEETIVYDYVLGIENNVGVDWLVRLVAFDDVNLTDVSYLKVFLSDVEVFDQIEVVDGSYVKYVGDFCSLNGDDYIQVIIKSDMFGVDNSIIKMRVEFYKDNSGVKYDTNLNIILES